MSELPNDDETRIEDDDAAIAEESAPAEPERALTPEEAHAQNLRLLEALLFASGQTLD